MQCVFNGCVGSLLVGSTETVLGTSVPNLILLFVEDDGSPIDSRLRMLRIGPSQMTFDTENLFSIRFKGGVGTEVDKLFRWCTHLTVFCIISKIGRIF